MSYSETIKDIESKREQAFLESLNRIQNLTLDHAINVVKLNKTSSPETNEVLSKIISQLEKLKS